MLRAAMSCSKEARERHDGLAMHAQAALSDEIAMLRGDVGREALAQDGGARCDSTMAKAALCCEIMARNATQGRAMRSHIAPRGARVRL
eukprot:7311785-Pyramimonas_sp.AAC.1